MEASSVRVRVTDRQGKEHSGEMLYLYHYPKAIAGKDGTVRRFEDRPQRVGMILDGIHTVFTVPAKVEVF